MKYLLAAVLAVVLSVIGIKVSNVVEPHQHHLDCGHV